MKLVSPTGGIVDAAPEAVERLIAYGFRPVNEPKPKKKRTSRTKKQTENA